MTKVLDASAILALLLREPGADVVQTSLAGDTRCGSANWSEVAQMVLSQNRDYWTPVRATLLDGYGVRIEPVLVEDAEWAACRWRKGEGLSLADRLCLALGERLDAEVLTADRAWGSAGRVRQIR